MRRQSTPGTPRPKGAQAVNAGTPAPGSPGADDVDASGFLARAVAEGHVSPAQVDQLVSAAVRAEAEAQARFRRGLAALTPPEADAALRALEADGDGRRWLRQLQVVSLEAFFADPVYGGNPSGLCWAWAGIRPPPARSGGG